MSEQMPDAWGVLTNDKPRGVHWRAFVVNPDHARAEAIWLNDLKHIISATAHRLVPAEQLDEARAELATLREAVSRLDPTFHGVVSHSDDCAEYDTISGFCDCNRPELQAVLDRAMEEGK